MAHFPGPSISIHARPPLQYPDADNSQTLGSLLERWLLWVHWAAVPLCFLLIPLFPSVPLLLILSLALGLALANGLLTWILCTGTSTDRVRLVGRLSTAFEWSLGLAIVFLFCHDPNSAVIALGILTTLVLIAAARFRLAGVLGAELAAGASGLAMFTLQASLESQSLLTAAGLPLVRWEAILLPVGLVTGALVHVTDVVARGEETHQVDDHLAHIPVHLTVHELELLSLLAQPELSYPQIAGQLSVTVRTIRGYLYRLSKKLRISGSREAIVAAARERGLLSSQPDRPEH